MMQHLRGARCMLVSTVFPEPGASAAGVRDFHLMEMLKRAGCEHVLLTSPAGNQTAAAAAVARFQCRTVQIKSNSTCFDALVADFKPDLVIMDRFVMEEQFGWRIRRVCPDAVRVLDTQDLHFLRRARQSLIEAQIPADKLHSQPAVLTSKVIDAGLHLPLTDQTLCRELSSAHRSDLVLTVSPYEQHLLVHHMGVSEHKVAMAPFLYDDSAVARAASSRFDGALRPFAERKHFFTIGNCRHAPNADSVRHMALHVWPRIRQKLLQRVSPTFPADEAAAVEFHAFGSYPAPQHLALDDPSTGFCVKGPLSVSANLARKLAPYRVHAAPLRFGAGIKGKIADSWMSGVPVLTTPIGAEGMHWHTGSATAGYGCSACETAAGEFGGAIADIDDVDSFAEQAVQLYCDQDQWTRTQAVGINTLRSHFSSAAVAPGLLSALEMALSQRSRRRQADSLQSAFWTKSAASVEHMSTYLEQKARAVTHAL
jgi:hypothetical protein